MTKSQSFFLATLLICALGAVAALCDDASLRTAWLFAPKSQEAKWNRQPLLDRLLAGLDLVGKPRANVMSLLGRPGYSAKLYPQRSEIDMYRLSAANDQSFRLDYDAGNVVTADMIDRSPCSCDFCTAEAPVLSAVAMTKSGLTRPSFGQDGLTMSAFESMLGERGKLRLSRDVAGGQMWLNYIEFWRVEGAPHQFLIVSGHTPSRDAPTNDVGGKRVESWALISFAPDCLAK
jgi:hypothetical protein